MKQSSKKSICSKFWAFITLMNICLVAWGQDQELIQRANGGDAKAQYELSLVFLNQKRDTTNYIKWLKESAVNNNPEAQASLAERYAKGDMGLCKDYSLCKKWIYAAAYNGDAFAMFDIHLAYADGRWGFDKDDSKSVYWLTKSAENGYALAAYCLGKLYKTGEQGVEVNEEKYLYWSLKAARGGSSLACFSLGLYYEIINKKEAIYWYKKTMDLTYEEFGHEDELASEHLRKLGVYYHPDVAANSSSVSDMSNSFPLIPSRKYRIIRTLMGDESRDFLGSDGYVIYNNRTIVVNLGFTTMEYELKHSPKQELGGIYSVEVTYKGEDGTLSVIDNGKTITIEPISLSFPMGYEVTE